jgi:hypothetical protein
MKHGLCRSLLGVVALTGGMVQAATFNLTGNGGALGSTETFSQDGITLSISESYANRQLVQNGQGIGVRGGSGDAQAIDGKGVDEFVDISFDQPVLLESITFGNWDNNDRVTFVGLASRERFGGNSGTVNLNELVQSFSMGAIRNRDDFRIASISVSAVPVPATAWLFGSALVGLTLRRKQRS